MEKLRRSKPAATNKTMASAISAAARKLRARRRSLVYGNTTIENPDVTRDIGARADADFERIFGSE